MSKSRELRKKRAEKIEQARALLNGSNPSASDISKAERLTNEADELKAQIELVDRVGAHEDELNQPWRRSRAGRGSLENDDVSRETWIDVRTGSPIHVLSKGQSFAAAVGGRTEGPCLGDLVRGVVSPGNASLEVRNALGESSGPGGGFVVGESLSAAIIDRLRAKTVCAEAGARFVPMETSRVSIARLAGDPQAMWKPENAPINESGPTFGQISLDAKTLTTVIRFSRELAEDSANFDQILTNAITKAFAIELDRAVLFGDATAGQPIGLYNLGISEVELGADGGALTSYDNIIDAIYSLENANSAPPTAAVMSPRTKRTFNKMKDGDGLYLQRPEAIRDLPFMTTTSVPVNQKHGAATTASTIIVGDFTQMLIGIRSELTLQLLTERYSDNFQYGMLAYLRSDIHVQHEESFCRITGIIP